MAEPATPDSVRVVICSYRSGPELGEALQSCLDSGLRPEQLTVVDNASPDGIAGLVESGYPGVRLITAEANLGFAAAVNRGASGTGGGEVLVLNPDAKLGPGALATMLAALGEDPLRGAISPRLVRPDGRLDPACRRSFPSPAIAFWRLSRLSRLGGARLGAYNLSHLPDTQAMAVDSGSGACLLVRREVWDRIGGFDEGYRMYGEDLELCWQIGALGCSVWYQPEAVVVHRKGSSSEQLALPMLVEFHRSMWRFYRLHYRRGAGALLAPLVALGIGARLVLLLGINAARRQPRVSP